MNPRWFGRLRSPLFPRDAKDMDDPASRIRLTERSLRCFVFGLLSLVPLVGLGPALLALGLHLKIWAERDDEWNPAKPYLIAGFCLAWLGILLSLGMLALVIAGLSHNL